MDLDASSNGGAQSPLDVIPIEAEDDDFKVLLRLLDRRDQRGDSVSWLNQELHARVFTLAP